MNRLSVRLTQLQDIGGNRIIVEKNEDVDELKRYISEKISKNRDIHIIKETDYRAKGRDDTGYRALHIIISYSNRRLELQLRSRPQHCWAETIERTSVVYGHHLKEKDGDPRVIQYFKRLSDIFYEIESHRTPSPRAQLDLSMSRDEAEGIIARAKSGAVLTEHVSDDIIRTLTTIEAKRSGAINNWILIFDWNTGCFVNWEIIPRDIDAAYKAYINNESSYSDAEGFEVVLVGASSVATIKETHSHYFGVNGYDSDLKNLDQYLLGFTSKAEIDASSKKLLHVMYRKNYWGTKSIAKRTLKNHYCQNIFDFDSAAERLSSLDLLIIHGNGSFSINHSKQTEIKRILGIS